MAHRNAIVAPTKMGNQMPDKVKSISAQQLAKEVKTAVAKNERLKAAIVDPKVAMIPPWVIGLILRPRELGDRSLGEVQELATDVAKSLPSARGKTPAALVHGGHIILGFVEEPVATTFEQ
jgi:hypothetical protein